MTSTVETLTFPTVGGTQPATLYRALRDDAPAVLIVPALGIRADYYHRQALRAQLIAAGMHVAVVDLPGQGESPARASRREDWGYRELVAHCRSAAEAVSGALPEAPLVLLGHSIGGQAALLASGALSQVRGVVLVASGTPFWRSWPGSAGAKILVSTTMCALMAEALGYFPGASVGFGGREARTFIRQWARLGRTGSYRLGAGFDGERLLEVDGPPVLAISLDGDDMAPPASMRHSLDKLRGRHVEHILWTDVPDGINHNRWPAQPGFVIEHLQRFITAHIQPEGGAEGA